MSLTGPMAEFTKNLTITGYQRRNVILKKISHYFYESMSITLNQKCNCYTYVFFLIN